MLHLLHDLTTLHESLNHPVGFGYQSEANNSYIWKAAQFLMHTNLK